VNAGETSQVAAAQNDGRRCRLETDGVDWRSVDVTDPAAATAAAAKSATLIYQCLNAPYTQWPKRFPPLQHGVVCVAERTGALLVSLRTSTATARPVAPR
jgi:hypothetical protein